jgi:hypothetical protein
MKREERNSAVRLEGLAGYPERELAALLRALPQVPSAWRETAQTIPQRLGQASGALVEGSAGIGTSDLASEDPAGAIHQGGRNLP